MSVLAEVARPVSPKEKVTPATKLFNSLVLSSPELALVPDPERIDRDLRQIQAMKKMAKLHLLLRDLS